MTQTEQKTNYNSEPLNGGEIKDNQEIHVITHYCSVSAFAGIRLQSNYCGSIHSTLEHRRQNRKHVDWHGQIPNQSQHDGCGHKKRLCSSMSTASLIGSLGVRRLIRWVEVGVNFEFITYFSHVLWLKSEVTFPENIYNRRNQIKTLFYFSYSTLSVFPMSVLILYL